MQHVWSMLCRNFIVEEHTRNISLIDIPNRLSFQGDLPERRPFEFPLPSEFYFLSRWISEEEDCEETYSAKVSIIDPTGSEIGSFVFDFSLEPPMGHVSTGRMSTLLYTVNGVYFFEVSLQANDSWKHIASIPLEIVHEQPESEQNDSEPTT